MHYLLKLLYYHHNYQIYYDYGIIDCHILHLILINSITELARNNFLTIMQFMDGGSFNSFNDKHEV